ncbi:MAG: fluoride efflux transporter CrcB [Gammaproteobacteria bacterium]|nr:fluoride efflux transporter CrcB [Gammaproteobacteria bacterium]
MFKPVIAICVGASSGALLRWWLGIKLNSLFPAIPPGTLVSNLVGGYIIGLAIAFFASAPPSLSPEWRLLIITGFCGALTTFSTFSAEITTLLQQGRFSLAAGAIATHVVGSVVMTLLGIATFMLIQNK